MSFRSILPAVFCFFIIVSCKDSRDTTPESSPEIEDQFPPTPMEISRRDSLNDPTTTPAGRLNRTPAIDNTESLEGRYMKVGRENELNCDCYCLEINFNSLSQLCLVKDEMYINTRMERGSGNTIEVYYEEPSVRNTDDLEIPWQQFDRSIPIARITALENNVLELDWLGFSINGDLANDYAIYGKDSLEGTYIKR